MDGARFANAVVAAGCSPAEMTWKAGVDALSFGGTKNGLMGVEGVVFFDPKTAWEFELRRKRGGHLFSKHRYLSAQMAAYLNDDLWREMASAANARAKRLSDGIAQIEGASLIHPTEANGVFASWPRAGHRRAHEAGAEYYFWPSDQSLDGPNDEVPARPPDVQLVHDERGCRQVSGPHSRLDAKVQKFGDTLCRRARVGDR